MGLFDKLREAVNTVVDSAQSASDPLSDDVVKKYFEILCGLRLSGAGISNTEVKKYIEFQLGTLCDDAKLQEALNLEALLKAEYPKTKKEEELKERVKVIKRTIAETNAYSCTKVEAYNICCRELIDEMTSEYNVILDIIKGNVNCQHFGQGIYKKIYEKYDKQIGTYRTVDLTCLVISNSLYEGNAITQEIVLEYLLDIYENRVNKRRPEAIENPIDVITGMALKALHFEKYREDKTAYTTISADDCRDFILNDKSYKAKIEKHPFEKEEYIGRYIENIKDGAVFRLDYSSYPSYELFWIKNCDDYFIDFVCNLVWREVAKNYTESVNGAGENISESRNASDVVNMLCDYFGN